MGSIIGGDINLLYADWNGHAGKSMGSQVFFKRLVWQNGYSQVANSPTWGGALPDVYHVRPENAFTSCSNVQGIHHCGALFDVKWREKCREHQVERLVSLYHKTNVLGLQSFLRDKLTSCANNGRGGNLGTFKESSKVLIVLSHIKFREKILTLK